MRFENFIATSSREWDRYLSDLYTLDVLERLRFRNRTLLYPSLLLCTETRSHYIAELIGAQRDFSELTVRVHKEGSTIRYLSQFTAEAPDPGFMLAAHEIKFQDLTLSQGVAMKEVESRFPFAGLFPPMLTRMGGKGALFDFAPTFQSAAIQNCLLLNRRGAAIRVKHVLSMIVLAKNVPERTYLKWLLGDLLSRTEARGVHIVPKDGAEDFVVASQFANVFLFPGLQETTIGEFLRTHPTILNAAFDSQQFVYEPTLEWREDSSSSMDEAINPDLLVQRPDGFFDIYDLKTAALQRGSITKGPRRRRRFIDYVEEGIAQLAHYREYFEFSRNAAHAWEKYQVRVKDPSLVLVVGNFENASATEIDEASRKLDGISIVDYDSLLQLFLNKRRVASEMTPKTTVAARRSSRDHTSTER